MLAKSIEAMFMQNRCKRRLGTVLFRKENQLQTWLALGVLVTRYLIHAFLLCVILFAVLSVECVLPWVVVPHCLGLSTSSGNMSQY